MKRALESFLPVILWGAIIFHIGGRSTIDVPRFDLPIDKIGHFTMYAILGALAGRAGWMNRRKLHWAWFIAGGLLLGALDELQQQFIPTRSADPLDWVADAAGFSFAFWLVYSRFYMLRRGDRG